LTSKSIFLAIKPSINLIKPSIKFNQVHKYLILDFSSSNWIFFVNRALISQQNTVKFQSLYFWTSSINFWLFSRRFGILFSLLLFFGFFRTYIFDFFVFSYFLCGDPKMGYNTSTTPAIQVPRLYRGGVVPQVADTWCLGCHALVLG